VALSDPGVAVRFARHRASLNARRVAFLDICELEGLRLSTGELVYFAHWITPEGASRRYDTRFFVAAAPRGQIPEHDAKETVAHLWMRPADALERHRSGEIDLILPTIRNLQAIAAFTTVAELLDAAAAFRDVPTVLPRLVADDGGARLLLPGDPGYGDPADPANPGDPVHLAHRGVPGRAGPAFRRSPSGSGRPQIDVDAAIRRASSAGEVRVEERGGTDARGRGGRG
jgi:hypothetical protein